jgi:P-type conjugative transfer protein TrbJ
VLLALAAAAAGPVAARAQEIVFDPTNYVENALSAARHLQSLANQAQMLINQARQLVASPYSHLLEVSETLRGVAGIADTLKGVAASVVELERQFEDLYPAAVAGLDPRTALDQALARGETARATALDLARTAAELERLAQTRPDRIAGALSASEAAAGQTAAIQSSTQMLAVLAEDLGGLRAILLAQSRLMAETAARGAAERAAAAEARRRFWSPQAARPAAPVFDPFPAARE